MPRKKLEITSSETFDALPDGRRKIKLKKADKFRLQRQQRAEAAAALFLDLTQDRTWAQIAEELELSPHQLKDLTKTREFDEAYSSLMAEVGHDPRYKAAQGHLSDMLPVAIRELRELLTSPRTSPTIKMRAIEKVLALNGVSVKPQEASEREELAKFLLEHGLNITNVENVNVNIPQEYQDKLKSLDVIDGEFTER